MLFEHFEFDNHYQVSWINDPKSGLRAINAIHRLRHGASGGGIRYYPYKSSAEALTDVLRLSRAMSYKMALADLPMGGGKTVVIGDPANPKKERVLRALAQWIDQMGGLYTCGPDVGTNSADMSMMSQFTPHVIGVESGGGTAGPTAQGVMQGILAAVQFKFGQSSLMGLTVAVQGLGGVGGLLCELLKEQGAELVIADVNQQVVDRVADETGARVVAPAEILKVPADLLAPCAMGAVLNDISIPDLKVEIVCGAANNQLAKPDSAQMLKDKNILMVPDYIANSGGTLHALKESGRINDADYQLKLEHIFDNSLRVFELARERNTTPHEAAQVLAEDILVCE